MSLRCVPIRFPNWQRHERASRILAARLHSAIGDRIQGHAQKQGYRFNPDAPARITGNRRAQSDARKFPVAGKCGLVPLCGSYPLLCATRRAASQWGCDAFHLLKLPMIAAFSPRPAWAWQRPAARGRALIRVSRSACLSPPWQARKSAFSMLRSGWSHRSKDCGLRVRALPSP